MHDDDDQDARVTADATPPGTGSTAAGDVADPTRPVRTDGVTFEVYSNWDDALNALVEDMDRADQAMEESLSSDAVDPSAQLPGMLTPREKKSSDA